MGRAKQPVPGPAARAHSAPAGQAHCPARPGARTGGRLLEWRGERWRLHTTRCFACSALGTHRAADCVSEASSSSAAASSCLTPQQLQRFLQTLLGACLCLTAPLPHHFFRPSSAWPMALGHQAKNVYSAELLSSMMRVDACNTNAHYARTTWLVVDCISV